MALVMMNNDILQDFALLTTGTLHVLLPQSQINSVSHIEDRRVAQLEIMTSTADLQTRLESNAIGFSTLSDDLTLLPEITHNIFVQTTWEIAPTIHWCWSEVKWLNQVKLNMHPIPTILHTEGLPAHSVTTLDDGTVALIFDSNTLLKYIISKGMS